VQHARCFRAADARSTAAPTHAPAVAPPQVETPLDPASRLSERLGRGNTVLLKREDMQPVFSFKARTA
jgi:threonine dehydratase